MHEPIPLISAPGSIFAFFIGLAYILLKNRIPDLAGSDGSFYLSLGAVALGAGPIFNIIFHNFWSTCMGGYQSFGIQRKYVEKGRGELETGKAYNMCVYDPAESKENKKPMIEYIRNLTAGYMTILNSLAALVICLAAFIIFISFHNAVMTQSSWIVIGIVILVSIFFIQKFRSYLTWHDREITHLEEELIGKELEKLLGRK